MLPQFHSVLLFLGAVVIISALVVLVCIYHVGDNAHDRDGVAILKLFLVCHLVVEELSYTDDKNDQKYSRDRSQQEEFASLYTAIATAVFLVFVVMAAQFESVRYSVMVMTTIPFSLIGSFGLLWLLNLKISMVSLIGFLMLSGTVVNNGILFVDAANQNRGEMELDKALIEAGATRIRPILMTTMTTVLAMFPMALALGNAGSTTQGLAVTDIGGLTASTILALLMLPVYYRMMSRKNKE